MRRGFTLIELMIVVAIIATIAAIAIPNLMQSKLQANESATIGAMKTLHTEQTKFKTGNHSIRTTGIAMDSLALVGSLTDRMYAHNLLNLWGTQMEDENGTLVRLGLISESLAKATTPDTSHKGYVFGLLTATRSSFEIVATPAVYSKTGIKTFYINEEGTIYSADIGYDDWTTLMTALSAVDPNNTDGTVPGTIGHPALGTVITDWPHISQAGWVVE